jgi:hypothetical protein
MKQNAQRKEKMLAKQSYSKRNVPVIERRRLFQYLEFRGVCIQNKAGGFPCPTVGKLLDRKAGLNSCDFFLM